MIAPWYLRFAADVFQIPAFLPVSSRAFALGAAAPLLFAAANALAQLPVAIEQPPKPELAMKMVYGSSSWRDARVAAFFGGRSPTLRAEVREVFRARYVEQVRNNRPVQAFLSGVSAAVVGVIVVVSMDLAREAIAGVPSIILATAAFVSIVLFKVDVAKVAAAAMICGALYAGVRTL